MNPDQIDSMLFPKIEDHSETYAERYVDHYVEQYRIYLHVFNSTIERRQKSNEFFMGLNTALMAFMGYIEVKEASSIPHAPIIFMIVPLIGISICYAWYLLIKSYKNLNRAKFQVIHRVEAKLPLSNFATEWEILGRGRDPKKYRTLSSIEKTIPIIFGLLYIVIFLTNVPQGIFTGLF